ncbi:PH domain-containing protein [Mycetocola spongiae]|uniref:PH domain-containing protein n=1 Tax=Mycetocola spongiae TaxID=2859226 RepID=UPI001CF33493|nr:PH domain-containing protein [Mycetocola spongiae]UCR88507.1 PH domain-containing protein [Mycetocola spongiae]
MTYPEQPPLPDAAASTPESLSRLELATQDWQRISRKYALIEQIGNALFFVIVAVATAVVYFLSEEIWPLLVGGAVLLITVIVMIVTPRRARSIGYRLRADDLLFRRGLMWQRFVAVPYGRMQLIDINRGPIARSFGLAELKFVTASAGTDVTIPGLPIAEAEALRDRLVEVAESRRTGL